MTKHCYDGDRLFVIRGFLSPEECAAVIARTEAAGFAEARAALAEGAVIDRSVRDSGRAEWHDPALAAELWPRAEPFVPARINNWRAAGFDERFRAYRYDAGQTFPRHLDGYSERPGGGQSHLTFLVYLNDDFEGGSTDFYDFFAMDEPRWRVRPERGTALVFAHRQFHAGAPVTRGRKHVLRTDVFYMPEP